MGEWDQFQLKDKPGQQQQPASNENFGNLWTRPDQRNLGGGVGPTSGIEHQQPLRPTERQQPYDASVQNAVHNGVLDLKYGDPNMDKYLAQAKNYQTIHIDTPDGIKPKHWVDENGHFFWFPGGNDNNAKHYYPAFSKAFANNGSLIDLEAQRLKVDEAYAASHG